MTNPRALELARLIMTAELMLTWSQEKWDGALNNAAGLIQAALAERDAEIVRMVGALEDAEKVMVGIKNLANDEPIWKPRNEAFEWLSRYDFEALRAKYRGGQKDA